MIHWNLGCWILVRNVRRLARIPAAEDIRQSLGQRRRRQPKSSLERMTILPRIAFCRVNRRYIVPYPWLERRLGWSREPSNASWVETLHLRARVRILVGERLLVLMWFLF